ncbi:hypothetical protein HS048_15155 [Planomonospora sp. ID91781]|uniref:hypothetical protein n=1 Tax=Planomonospora sp. ID91781 TaxID=2738135 RepID=UPI0018C36B85|nr:hypothetical protein [Planomonospora sp. ID91781]MBG0822079.1 hypothetical protein [Planomonospora sp. ID91781]
MRNRISALLFTVFAAICSLILFSPSAGAAGSITLYHGSDYADLLTSSTLTYVEVCDGEAGNGVYLEYQTYAIPYTRKLWDPDGKGGDCGKANIERMTRARICENNVSCSGWQQIY